MHTREPPASEAASTTRSLTAAQQLPHRQWGAGLRLQPHRAARIRRPAASDSSASDNGLQQHLPGATAAAAEGEQFTAPAVSLLVVDVSADDRALAMQVRVVNADSISMA